MRKTYILIISIIILITIITFTTYAMFTADVNVGEFVNLTASSLPTDTIIQEYERITIAAGDSKKIDLNITNSTSNSLYYGVWYEMVDPSTINSNINIGKLTGSTNATIGQLASNGNITVQICIVNNSSADIIINVGVGYSNTSSLNLPTGRSIITGEVSVDRSGANAPDLVQGLIPVKYDDTNQTWVKADSLNSGTSWYNYDDKRWANAVLVSSTNRTTYMNANAGIAIPESDVLAYYVWIPRYKYKVWNINKLGQSESNYNYNAYTEGIDIVFEDGTQSTGTISCTSYSFAAPNSSTPNETCSGSNGDYYTHPAFTFGTTQLKGIWVGKFELSSETPSATDGGGNSTTLTVRVKPNVASWRNNYLTNFYKVIYDMQITNNIYGLNTSRTNTDSHMMKNMEWGAVAYLINSKYGRCTNNVCTEVTINNSSTCITGNAGNTVSASSASGTTNAYNTVAGQLASTTGNIYGIYDMSGGAAEDVMGNMSGNNNGFTFYANDGGSNFSYSDSTSKYIDTYAYGTSDHNQMAYNRARLGDATGEVALSTSSTISYYSWYRGTDFFVYKTASWFNRGDWNGSSSLSSPFGFQYFNGTTNDHVTSRATLVSLQ